MSSNNSPGKEFKRMTLTVFKQLEEDMNTFYKDKKYEFEWNEEVGTRYVNGI